MKAATWQASKGRAQGCLLKVDRRHAGELEMFGTARKRRHALVAADAARDRGDWIAAAISYRQAIKLGADRSGVWVQQGHALKESGDFDAAEQSYLRALKLAPIQADTLLHIGHVRKLGERHEDAVMAYSEALKLDPGLTAARRRIDRAGCTFGAAGIWRKWTTPRA